MMNTSSMTRIAQELRLGRIALVIGLVLLVPLVAMQFTDEVRWSFGDFVVMGALLCGAGLGYTLATRRSRSAACRLGVGVAIGGVFLLTWAHLAVGLF